MEEIMLQRLQLIVSKLEDCTSKALGFMKGFNDLQEVEVTIKKLEMTLAHFDTVLNNYFRTSMEPSADDVSTFCEKQLMAVEVLAELTVKLKDAKADRSQTSKATLSCKLPKLDLPEFGGDILEWHQFWDRFESNIGNKNLSDVDKLLYLKSSLKGEAKRT